MILSDIVALAKSGFSMADIKELMAMEEVKKEDPEKAEPEKAEPEKAEPEKAEPDYKSLYEESQEKLKDAQKINLNRSASDDELTDEEALAKLIKSI